VRQGERRQGHTQDLYVINLADTSARVLLSGNFGPIQPVWSPDGQQIAFTRKSYEGGSGHGTGPGNIWTVVAASGEARQLTFIDTIKQPPVWSPDGRYLAFVTATGQLGMVAVDQPGRVWRIETDLIHPQLTSLAFIP
jgi:Tol biopolymer transport system component